MKLESQRKRRVRMLPPKQQTLDFANSQLWQRLRQDDQLACRDPREVNDRLLLGLKGTMSEYELSLFRQRAREAFELKVAAGHAMWEVPIGFTRDELDRVEKIADRQVQAAIEGVFRKLRELGSARQTAL